MRTAEQRSVPVRDVLLDAALAGVVFTLSTLAPRVQSERTGSVTTVTTATLVFGAIACAALVGRRVRPVATLVVAVAGACLATVSGHERSSFFAAVVVAVFTVARRNSRRWAGLAGVSAAVASVLASVVAGGRVEVESFGIVAWSLFAAAAGDGARTRHDYLRAVEDRAERAEQSREEEARRRVAEERLSIARELHDVVAHHVTVINVQAQLGRHLLTVGQPGAETALGHIATASRTLLEEFRSLLGVLRSEGESPASTRPSPTIAEIDALVDSFAGTGLRVQFTRSGQPRPLPPAIELVTYRVVQEALTNAQRYGTGEAHVTLEHRRDALVVRVDNPVDPDQTAPAASSGTGHGLVGIRERAAAVGGSSHPGFLDPTTFRVEAVLPIGAPA